MHQLHWIDVSVIILFFLAIFIMAANYMRRAGKDTGQFFLSGRNLPWYIAGTAMVATTFAADTPLAVTELVARNGIAGNWLWWNLAIGGMLTVFFFSRLWRRSGIMTDVEFIEFRYSGKPAAVLRGFRALYLGIFMNAIVMGWVHKAMEKIFRVTFPGMDAFVLVAGLALIIGLYASAAGLLGTSRTDSFQFVFAMTGCVILAIIVMNLPQVGGAAALKTRLAPQVLSFLPRVGSLGAEGVTGGALALTAGSFFAYIGLQWWSSWYPGADPGGGGYVAQRMMSAKDEKHSLFATLWFNIAHYTLRPWPWILVALAALIVLPRGESPEALELENPALYRQVVEAYPHGRMSEETLDDPEAFLAFYEKYENTVDPGIMYPKLMIRYLPRGLLGLLVAVFLAAYMSTISSQLNWGTSYVINDFYRRFLRRKAPEKHYVRVSRLAMIGMILFSLFITKFFLGTISGAWVFIINASAGIGAVLILRWFWWRINAWSEISAMIVPLVIYPWAVYGLGLEPPLTLYPTVLGTTLIWLTVTLVTPPVKSARLHEFYRCVHPGGWGWRRVERETGVAGDRGFGRLFVDWICGVVLIYAALFSIGSLLFGEVLQALIYSAVAVLAALIIYLDLRKTGFSRVMR
ncbi:MAG TPA: sodium:proline symporter [bacterium]|nr:sodium:proline symporter [bacterium]